MTGTINLGDEWEITADETVDDLVIRHKPTDNSFALGADGTFTPLPELAITSVTTVPDKAARLSVSAEEGDIVIQTDVSKTFVLTTNDPTVNSNWVEIQIDVLNTIDGQQITPSQVGTSSNRTDVVADSIEAGTIGSSGSRPDLFADEIDANTLTSTTTETQFGSDISEVTAIDSVVTGSSASQTVTIPSGFSTVKIELSATSNSPDVFQIRVNGISSNYTQTDVDGTTRTGQSSWRIGSINNTQLVGSLTIRTAPETIGQGSNANDMNPVIIGPAVGDGGTGIVGGELQQRVVTVDTVEFLPTGTDTTYQADIRGYSFN
jgi:hypothetical protein